MKIKYCSDYEEMSQLCSDSILTDLKKNNKQLICVATGNSPNGVYENLANAHKSEPSLFEKLKVIKLDEWGGISASDENSCETFIQKKILGPLQILSDRYISFESKPASPEEECVRIQNEIKRHGPIDTCILGLGKNGHIGFNEPGKALAPYCHVAKLSKESLRHEMTATMQKKPSYGLTLGMANILQSKKIVLLITGANKNSVIENLLTKTINPDLPASFLWLHQNVTCYIDSNAI
ncbi:galactosamine-6-phosphate isomerase [Maribacter hydrothermalis]|uniref:Glucosamine/galactosamine-6-phosphate isomerase domain-containing protein n=1 Tax=Maribacter hydrothermalis TaxID=1836467 RepID=A0A1B7ZF37_9FLAO|nr:galactosamine-6-phosphate isomerase [Maribacter hydrothermalis]APQ17702.1 hypothetical protein BTR34_10335 [Maribacter hydrothermalis]OBR42177.1 hypothetical protein A9200_01960 [Maribacter hydrothermalis]